MRPAALCFAVLCLFLSLGFSKAGIAGSRDAEYLIHLMIRDRAGRAVEGAQVVMTGPEGVGGVAAIATTTRATDAGGLVTFSTQKPGKYTLKVSHERFKDHVEVVEIVAGATEIDRSITLIASGARIRVQVEDFDNQERIEGASIVTKRGDDAVKDRMTTDRSGEAVVVIPQNLDLRKGTTFEVTVSHPDYETESRSVRVEDGEKFAPFRLKRKTGLKTIVIVTRESGTRAPIMNARVRVDGGDQYLYNATTDGEGRASLRVGGGRRYRVNITTEHFDAVEDFVDFTDADTGSTAARTYDLERKSGDREIRRALLVKVRAKQKNGSFKPVEGAYVEGPGLHAPVTDENGNILFFHTVPPGEIIRVTASKASFKTTSGEVTVRDKGVMVDLRQFSRDTGRGMSDMEAFRKQNVTAVDSMVITLSSDVTFNPTLSGDVVPSKGRVKLDERIDVSVNVLYSGGESDTMEVKETVELFDPSGKVIQNNFGSRTMRLDEYSKRNFSITCQEPGNYRLKSTITGPDGITWTDSATFAVTEEGGAKPAAKKGPGYYRLASKKVGKGSAPADGQYGTWSGTVSEGSLNFKYESKPPYDAHADLRAVWSKPPTIIKPGEIIELTMSASASVTGKDRGAVGIGPQWNAVGAAEVLENKKVYSGIAGDGKEYPSGEGRYRFKAGSGGKLVLESYQLFTFGEGDWHPCIYTYEWVDGLAAPAGSGTKPTTMKAAAAAGDAKPGGPAGTYEPDGAVKLPYGSSPREHKVSLRITPGSNPNTMTISGAVSPVGSYGYEITLTGTYFVNSKKVSGKGSVTNGLKDKWNVTFDGVMPMAGQMYITLHVKSTDATIVRHANIVLKKK